MGFTQDHRDGLQRSSCHSDEVVRRHGVARFEQVIDEFRVGWNEGQYAAHAAAKRAVSCQGGTAILASLFGGVNLVFDRWAGSGERRTNEYVRLHSRFSNASLHVATSFSAVVRGVPWLTGEGEAELSRLRAALHPLPHPPHPTPPPPPPPPSVLLLPPSLLPWPETQAAAASSPPPQLPTEGTSADLARAEGSAGGGRAAVAMVGLAASTCLLSQWRLCVAAARGGARGQPAARSETVHTEPR